MLFANYYGIIIMRVFIKEVVMNYDEFVSFMADYNQRLYPDHSNMWKKIHLLDAAHLNAKTTKTFRHFKSRLSETLKNFSKADIEKLLVTDNGPRPHPNTFILKKLGITPNAYKNIRYAIFNHTRYADGNNSDNLIPLVNKDNSRIEKTEIVPDQSESKSVSADSDDGNQDLKMQIQKLQSQIDEIKSQIKSMSDRNYMISYLEKFVNEQTEKLRDDLRAALKQIQNQVSKKNAPIQSANAGASFLGGILGGSAVEALAKIVERYTSNPANDLENRINDISQKVYQMDQSLQEQSKNIQAFFEWMKFISNITNGFNYLRLFGVPVTREDWDRLSDNLKQSWSPSHIKPPLTDGRRKAIAESIKRNEPPTVEMCYDFG